MDTKISKQGEGVFVVVIGWYLDLELTVQSVAITTKVVSSNPVGNTLIVKKISGANLVNSGREQVPFGLCTGNGVFA